MSIISILPSLTSYRQFGGWIESIENNPTVYSAVLETNWRAVLTLFVAWLFEYLVWRLISPFYRRLGYETGSAETNTSLAEESSPPVAQSSSEFKMDDAAPPAIYFTRH